ncbi:hypothetical protein [Aureimonas sp. Leaf454]|uniref:hypothetical protein n=1 Tax=Aureimonas sp. Leaf454 TaxID=1736381 RepID=UPI000A7FCB30|nr:hypothetical protein [Aureimonas sp. Leaf454]
MRRAASPVHQAGEGSAAVDRPDGDLQIHQPVDPFEEMPHGVFNEEVGFGSLAFEDSVIVERGPRRPHATATPRLLSAGSFARLRAGRSFA